jgi:hypothetical protein
MAKAKTATKPAAIKPAATKKDPYEGPAPTPLKGVRVSPDLPFLQGNSASFFARGGKGVVTAKITRAGVEEDWLGPVSSTDDEAGLTILFERPGKFTVSFYEDDKQFATGSFEVPGP